MVSINDFRNISDAIFNNYNIDLTEYAFTILNRRITNSLHTLHYKNVDNFVKDVANNHELCQRFLYKISVDETEMFRDPEVWQIIKKSILPEINTTPQFAIWLPDASSGDDLYSIIITLLELGYYKQIKIIVSTQFSVCIDKMQQGIFYKNKIKINNANYLKAGGKEQLSVYCNFVNNTMQMHSSLLENVTFINQSINNVPDTNINLIIFRNKMLYYNQSTKIKLINVLYNKLYSTGFFICGIKESLGTSENIFKIFDKHNSIYIK